MIDTIKENKLLCIGLGIAGIILAVLVLYRSNQYIVIDGRYWKYNIVVGHTETYYNLECTTNSQTRTKTCTMQPHTRWITSCTQVNTGYELPPIPPVLKCQDRSLREDISYHVTYHEEDTLESKQASFNSSHWADLTPNTTQQVEMTITRHITKVLPQ